MAGLFALADCTHALHAGIEYDPRSSAGRERQQRGEGKLPHANHRELIPNAGPGFGHKELAKSPMQSAAGEFSGGDDGDGTKMMYNGRAESHDSIALGEYSTST